jgi:acyl-CoA synthetase (AMP-forming)/AMP-acid ligase II
LVDRKEDMILAGGQNIFPANIALVRREHSAVAEVAVAAIPSPRFAY